MVGSLMSVVLVSTCVAVTVAQTPLPVSPDFLREASASDTSQLMEEQRVLAVEDAWVNAEINRDEAILRQVIDDRFVFNANSGALSDKEALIKNVKGWNMTGQTITDRTVLVDGDVAVVFGTTEMRFDAEEKGESVSLLRYTATYIKRGDQWRALALQMAKRTLN